MGILSPSRGKERHPYHQVRTGSDAGDLSSQPTAQEIEARILPMAHENPSPPLRNRCRTPFLKKPMSVVTAEEVSEKLSRHLGLFDLLALGVGGTVGSGVFVLAGAIAYDDEHPAGPSVVLSFLISGLGCVLSGLSFSEMASRIPSAGSTYAYAYVTLGEVMAFIAGWCLTLEYGVSSAAVARNWGDKFSVYLESCGWTWLPFGESSNINIWAGILELICVLIMLVGLNVSQMAVNVFTVAKLLLVGFMTLGGFGFFKRSNLKPFAPSGMKGILRGAMRTFFGYLGYDEVCCLGAEAKDPHRNIPLAVMGTISLVTVLYVLASFALVGMQPFREAITHEENRDSAFSFGFKSNGARWAYEIVSIGELSTLPLVVLVSLIAQPRLQFAMAEDGLLPKVFSEIDNKGNLFKGTLIAGILVVFLSVFLPFEFLDDMTSAGMLIAFNLTNSGLVIVRRHRPTWPSLIMWLIGSYNMLALLTAFIWARDSEQDMMVAKYALAVLSVLPLILLAIMCPEIPSNYRGFRTPLVPWLPAVGIAFNWHMLAQLSWQGIWMIVLYIGLALITYFLYGYWRSVGAQNGWRETLARGKKGESSDDTRRDSDSETDIQLLPIRVSKEGFLHRGGDRGNDISDGNL